MGDKPASLFTDLSSNNAAPDIKRYAAAGHPLIALKATEGTTYTWTEGRQHADDAHRHGLRVLFYHFARPGSGVAQAEYFLREIAGNVKAGDGLVIDCEVPGVNGKLVGGFLNRVHKSHPNVDLWIYGGPYFLRDNGIRPVHGARLWLADYAASVAFIPPGWKDYDAWQFTSTGSVKGVSGRVDVSRLRVVPAKPKPGKPVKPHGFWGRWLNALRRWRKGHGK